MLPTKLAAAALSICAALMSCTGPAETSEASENLPQPYGTDDSLTADQAEYLQDLTYPQSYDAMKNTFGLPNYRTEQSDIYNIEDGRQIEVFYDGTQAIGHEVK